MKDLRLWANYYYNMGFNVTHIIPHLNEGKAKNPPYVAKVSLRIA